MLVNDDMFGYSADEPNKDAHQKSDINLRTTSKELETLAGIFFHMGYVKMLAVGCSPRKSYWYGYC